MALRIPVQRLVNVGSSLRNPKNRQNCVLREDYGFIVLSLSTLNGLYRELHLQGCSAYGVQEDDCGPDPSGTQYLGGCVCC